MPGQSDEWIRLSMRTPGLLIFGLVMAPCGWILNLTATVAPSWRTLNSLPNIPIDQFLQQGIWDICLASTIKAGGTCGQSDATYFSNQIIKIAQGLMVASLCVTILGLCVAIPGVRCWKNTPNWTLAGLGGLLIFISGVLTLIPIAWYTNILSDITTISSRNDVRVGYCIILGYIGGICEVLGGFVMCLGFCRCCGGRNRGERRVEEVTVTRFTPKHLPRPEHVPRVTRPTSSTSSSVPYSREDLDDDVSFPRAKTPPARSVNTFRNNRPYDADL